MWLEQYPASFLLFCLSGFALMVGVFIDERRHIRVCNEQRQRFEALEAK